MYNNVVMSKSGSNGFASTTTYNNSNNSNNNDDENNKITSEIPVRFQIANPFTVKIVPSSRPIEMLLKTGPKAAQKLTKNEKFCLSTQAVLFT